MSLLTKGVRVYREHGTAELISRGSRYLNSKYGEPVIKRIATPVAIIKLIRDGRDYEDAKYIIENTDDRHDALIGPTGITGLAYQPAWGRAIHRYRYLLAINEINTSPNRALDVAGGLGYGSEILHTRLGEVDYFSCEIDRHAVEYAKKYYSNAYHFQGDAQNLPFKNNQFGLITSFETMEHLSKVESYLKELSRISAENATLFISVPFEEDLDINAQKNRKSYPHVQSFDFNRLDSLVSSHFSEASLDYYGQNRPKNIIDTLDTSTPPPGIQKYDEDNAAPRTLIVKISQSET